MIETLKDKRVLVTGVTGQVGGALLQELAGKCELVKAARHGADVDLDLNDGKQIVSVLSSVKADIVFNAAAYTQVDKAETEPELAHTINASAPGIIAEQCKKHGSTLIHYSTDYVFPGTGNEPLTEDDPVAPINVYGKTKLAGERAIQEAACDHLIFRTCWVYDGQGRNFLNTILGAARKTPTLRVVNDQYGTPTSAAFIATTTLHAVVKYLIKQCVQDSNNIYHLTASGYTSWYDFARKIVDASGQQERLVTKEVIPVSTHQFPTKAKRPNWSVLSNEKLIREFNTTQIEWEQLFYNCLNQIYSNNRHLL